MQHCALLVLHRVRDKSMPKPLPYRPCVGVCVINRDGLVFVGRRSSGPEHIDEKHAWQM